MKIFCSRILFLLLILEISIVKAEEKKFINNLMPVPEEIKLNEGEFRLKENFNISVSGNSNPRIYPAATRMLRRLSGRTGLFFHQDVITKEPVENSQMQISINRPGKVVLNEDESYFLSISEDKIKLDAETDLGALRGLETFLQLLDEDTSGYFFPDVAVKDKPRFPWRGLMMDVSRHFMPVDVVKRNIDGMAMVKMNVLHLHLSDDQGFRIECKTFPQLNKLGSDRLYFTHEQIKEIIKYADDRGIRVVPEFDIPGHSTSWLAAYPELASAPGPYKIERLFGVFDPVFDPTNEKTYAFFKKFFAEITELFPDEYFHIGGDENNGVQWNASTKINEFRRINNIPDNHALQAYFNKRILKMLTANGKKMIGWDEILHPEMPNNIVIQSWRGTDALVNAAKKRYMGILSSGYYIDLAQSAEFHYLNDPVPSGSDLSEMEKQKILGGEATMWAELVNYETVDSRIWPRTAVIAERFWSPQEVKDVDDMYRRLEILQYKLEEAGLTHIKNQEVLFRRLSNYNNVSSIKNLIDAIEPLEGYDRLSQGITYTSYSPLSRTVDAAFPDALKARKFRKYVDRLLNGDLENENDIRNMLQVWSSNHNELVKIISQSPVLKEIEPMSLNLSKISTAGLEAIEYIINKQSPIENWIKEKQLIIKEAKKSYGQAEIVITPAIEKLIEYLKKYE